MRTALIWAAPSGRLIGHARRGHRSTPPMRYIQVVMSYELDRLTRLAADSRQQARNTTDPNARERWEIIATVYEKLSARAAASNSASG
jgi:hypothetical protein